MALSRIQTHQGSHATYEASALPPSHHGRILFYWHFQYLTKLPNCTCHFFICQARREVAHLQPSSHLFQIVPLDLFSFSRLTLFCLYLSKKGEFFLSFITTLLESHLLFLFTCDDSNLIPKVCVKKFSKIIFKAIIIENKTV